MVKGLKMTGTLRKVGGSLVVRIPKKYVDSLELNVGDNVEWENLRKVKRDYKSVIGLFPGIGPWTPEMKEWLRGNDRES